MDIVKLNKKRIFFRIVLLNLILFVVFLGITYLFYSYRMNEPVNFIKLQQHIEANNINKIVKRYFAKPTILKRRIASFEKQTPFKVYLFENNTKILGNTLEPNIKNQLQTKKGNYSLNNSLFYSCTLEEIPSKNNGEILAILEFPSTAMKKIRNSNFKYIAYKGLALYIIIAFILSMATLLISMINFDKFQTKIFGDLIKQTNDGIVITDDEGNIIYANESFLKMFNITLSKLLGQNIANFNSNIHNAEFFKAMLGRLNREGSWEGEVVNTREDGNKVFTDLRLTTIINKQSKEKFCIGIYKDKTASANEKIDMLRLQLYDSFTGLPNRTYAVKYLDKLIGSKVDFACISVALENFKNINDSYGADTGDKVLLQFIEKIKEIFADNIFIARIDGKKTCIVIENFEDNLESAIKKLSGLSKREYKVFDNVIKIELNLGIAFYPETAEIENILNIECIPAVELFRKNNLSPIAKITKEKENKAKNISVLIKKAITNNEFSINYQPRIDSDDNTVIGAEALLRWNNKELGNVSPMSFIPIAEQNGFIDKITEWTIAELCCQLLEWKAKHLSLIPVSVNISPLHFKNGFADNFIEKFKNYDLNPHEVQLELTELALSGKYDKIKDQINKLSNSGFDILIDNFGTGNSDLEYLKNLSINMLKIDRQFIKNFPEKDDGNTVKIIIKTAKSLGLEVVGEGAETSEQIDFLRTNGCHIVQGYYYSKPVSTEEFGEFLKTGSLKQEVNV